MKGDLSEHCALSFTIPATAVFMLHITLAACVLPIAKLNWDFYRESGAHFLNLNLSDYYNCHNPKLT